MVRLPELQDIQPSTITDFRIDVSFRKIQKNTICFHIWKIEEDRVEFEARSQFGTFFDDGVYMIYAASPFGIYVNQDTITRESKSCSDLQRFIHFWLGEKVSEEKRTNVVHKVRELDSYFGHTATEYRETQFNESPRFLSYFKGVLNIRSSALITYKGANRLYRVFGRKWLRCVEMDSVDWGHFSSDCIMMLKTESHIYVWIGRYSSTAERNGAMGLAKDLQANTDEISIVDDGYEQSMPESSKRLWNSLLPINKRSVKQMFGESTCRQVSNKLKIYECDFGNGRLHMNQLDIVIPTREDLKGGTVMYLLDDFSQCVWLWVGLKTSSEDKNSAIGNGRAYIKKKKYPFSVTVVRVIEGHEPIEFIRLFTNWSHNLNEGRNKLKPISSLFGKPDLLTLYERPKMAAETQLVDDGSGERKIYCINRNEIEQLDSSNATVIFFTNCCYVVQYSLAAISLSNFQITGVTDIVYQWNGSEAASDTLSKCEIFAKCSFEERSQKAMFVQMGEFDETPHFLQIFSGRLIILHNKSLFNTVITKTKQNDSCNNTIEDIYADEVVNFILKVYGDASYNSKAVEVYPLSSMSSRECYVFNMNKVWLWCGHASTGDGREVAKNIASMFGEYTLIMEGKESNEFWNSVKSETSESLISNCSLCNSKDTRLTDYQNHNDQSSTYQPGNWRASAIKRRPLPQLFLIFIKNKQIQTLEIFAYKQSDLMPENVYILDFGTICYIWLGKHAQECEKGKYLKLAQYYLESVSIGRGSTTAIGVIRQGDEPNIFRGFFEIWNSSLWSNYVPYEQRRQFFALPNSTSVNNTMCLNIENENSSDSSQHNRHDEFDQYHKYPVSVLQQEVGFLPAEVNPLKREVHLTHDDFVALFDISLEDYNNLPLWKKQALKKKHRLF